MSFIGTLRMMRVVGPVRALYWPVFDALARRFGWRLVTLTIDTYTTGKNGVLAVFENSAGKLAAYRNKAKKEFDATQRSDLKE